MEKSRGSWDRLEKSRSGIEGIRVRDGRSHSHVIGWRRVGESWDRMERSRGVMG